MVFFVQLTTQFPEGSIIKLLPIVGNQDSRDPKSTNDSLLDEIFDVLFLKLLPGVLLRETYRSHILVGVSP